MKRHNADAPGTIYLGHQGENHAKAIEFDCTGWTAEYGSGEVQLLHRRCGEADPYPVPLRKEGDLMVWDVSDVDTACTGKGEVQLLYFAEGKLAKGSLATTDVQPSLSDPGPVPDAQQPFLDAVAQQAAKAEAAAKRAEDAAGNAGQGGGGVGTTDHNLLTNRDQPDQHPMGAITGLEAALRGKLTQADLQGGINNALAQAKASGAFNGKDGADGGPGPVGPRGPAGISGAQNAAELSATVPVSLSGDIEKNVQAVLDAQAQKVQHLSANTNVLTETVFTAGDDKTLPYRREPGKTVAFAPAQPGAVYTGTFNLAQLFLLPNASATGNGLTIEQVGNHITMRGTATANTYYCASDGKIEEYEDLIQPPSYTLPAGKPFKYVVLWNKATATGGGTPSLAIRKIGGGNAAVVSVNAPEKDFTASADCGKIVWYIPRNTTIDYDTFVSLFLADEIAVNREQKNTSLAPVLQGADFILQDLTWGTQADGGILLRNNRIPAELTPGRTVWIGDSIAQLRDLPNLVGRLTGIEVLDCSFAGAPMTYSQPDKYQQLGFMELAKAIASGDFAAQEKAINLLPDSDLQAERRTNLARLKATDFSRIDTMVVLAGTNDTNNAFVATSADLTKFRTGMETGITTLLTKFPQIKLRFISPIWRGDRGESGKDRFGNTLWDFVLAEKEVCAKYNIPFYDLYHDCGINQYTEGLYLESDKLHPTPEGDLMLAKKCAKNLLYSG